MPTTKAESDDTAATPPATPDDLMRRFEALGISVSVHHHPPLFTVEDSQALRGNLPGGHCKNLFLRDKRKRNWLVVTLEDKAVDLKQLQKKLDAGRLSFGSAERLRQFLGVAPGAVTPFALINDLAQAVNVVLDADMLAFDLLNYHPLINTQTVAISKDDLVRFIEACGHRPMVMAL